jgi:hypothetical protein
MELKDFFYNEFEEFDVATRHKNFLKSPWGDRYEELYDDDTETFLKFISDPALSYSEFVEFVAENF